MQSVIAEVPEQITHDVISRLPVRVGDHEPEEILKYDRPR